MGIVAHTMEYKGEKIQSELNLTNYKQEEYNEYKRIYEECFFDMRTALELYPVNCCDNNETLLEKASGIFIMKIHGELIGSVAIYGNEIDDLIVAKEYQNKGYGKNLLLFAIAKMQATNIAPIILHVADWNQTAISLYLNNGFSIVKTETFNFEK